MERTEHAKRYIAGELRWPGPRKRGRTYMEYTKAYELADAVKNSEEYRDYHSLQDEVMGDETVAALIREYKKLQVKIQMEAMSGRQTDSEDMQRFSGISTLLFSKPEVSRYLLSEMRLQQAMGDIFRILTEAAGIDLGIPGADGD